MIHQKPNTSPKAQASKRGITSSIGAITLTLIYATAYAAEPFPQQIDRLSRQWQQLEQQHSHLEAQWLKREAILEQQASLLDIEATNLTAVINKDQQSTGAVEQQRNVLLQQQIKAEADQQTLETHLGRHLKRLLNLQYRLPPPLQLQWQAAIGTAQNSAEKSDNSKNLALILQLLSQLEDFENRIALNQTIMLIDGIEVQVQQFYMGLSHGWYVDQSGHYAGYGKSTDEGWQWQTQTAALDTQALLKTVAILTNESAPTFVSLPITLTTTANTGTSP